MRFPVLLTCLGASALAMAAHAQEMQAPPAADQPVTQMPPAPSDAPAPVDNGTTVPVPADSMAPGTESSVPPPPPPPAAYNAAPTAPAPGGAPPVEMGPPQPQVQAVPAAPAEYPVCSKTVTDACRNRSGS